MRTYHAYQLYTADEAVSIGVDCDAAGLLLRLANDLNDTTKSHGIETLEVGTVAADTHDDAINLVRAGNWQIIGAANGRSPS